MENDIYSLNKALDIKRTLKLVIAKEVEIRLILQIETKQIAK